ncbi:hypothetical protein J4475_00645 [Candidatus Woesearchaeota archaeon]|nr:hypothetical protein [Candidatus Woesearchaeota archaeon]
MAKKNELRTVILLLIMLATTYFLGRLSNGNLTGQTIIDLGMADVLARPGIYLPSWAVFYILLGSILLLIILFQSQILKVGKL